MINQIFKDAIVNLNPELIISLMALGFIIKHVPLLEKVENSLIPVLLLCLGVVSEVLTDGFSTASMASGVINAAVATGLHQQGKNIFTSTIIPMVSEMFGSLGEEEKKEDVDVVTDKKD